MSRLRGAACALSFAAALALAFSPAVARDARETDTPAAKHKAHTLAARHKHARHKENERKEKEPASKEPFGSIPKGPLQIIISIDQQRLHLYSDGTPVADAMIATGVPQHPTPMGVFSVIEKERFHRSNIYSGAPMPYMQRITWSGVALHEGVNLGHPASHGCIRMPGEFAARLWVLRSVGARVVIARPELQPEEFADPHLFVHRDKRSAPAPSAAAPPALEPIKTAQTIDASKTTDVAAPSIPHASDAADDPPMTLRMHTDVDSPAGAAAPAASSAAATDSEAASKANSSDREAVTSEGGADGAAGNAAVKADPPATAAETAAAAGAKGRDAAVETNAVDPQPSPAPEGEHKDAAAEDGKGGDRPATAAAEDGKGDDRPATAADTTTPASPAVNAPAKIEPTSPQAPPAVAIDRVPAAAPQSAEPAKPAARISNDTATPSPEAAPETVPVPSPKPAAIAKSPSTKTMPITIFVSRKLKRLYVRQNFAPLFDTPIAIDHPERPLGTHVFTALEYLNDGAALRWNVISLPAQQPRTERAENQPERTGKGRRTHEPPAKPAKLAKPMPEPPAPTPQEALARIEIPPDVVEEISELIVPGSSLIVSDQDLGEETGEGTDFIVVTR